tara:strand:- start:727 stop:984 length:258 start_codon:yes stop_codon:yes gene_type:complete
MTKKLEFRVGDLVVYQPSHQNFYADGSKELGVVIEVLWERVPLYINFPDKSYFEHEYKIKWINSGYTSTLLGFNLKKIEIKEENT